MPVLPGSRAIPVLSPAESGKTTRLGLGVPKGFPGEGPFLLSPGRRKEGNAICGLNFWKPTTCLSYSMETQAQFRAGCLTGGATVTTLQGGVRLSLNTAGLPPFTQPRPFSGLERELPSSSRRILIREEKAIGGEGEVPGTSPHSSS